MKKLMQKYGMKVQQMMMMAALDNLTFREINDLEYLEDRIIVFLEN